MYSMQRVVMVLTIQLIIKDYLMGKSYLYLTALLCINYQTLLSKLMITSKPEKLEFYDYCYLGDNARLLLHRYLSRRLC